MMINVLPILIYVYWHASSQASIYTELLEDCSSSVAYICITKSCLPCVETE